MTGSYPWKIADDFTTVGGSHFLMAVAIAQAAQRLLVQDLVASALELMRTTRYLVENSIAQVMELTPPETSVGQSLGNTLSMVLSGIQ